MAPKGIISLPSELILRSYIVFHPNQLVISVEETIPVEFHIKLAFFKPIVYGSYNGLVLMMSIYHHGFVPDMLVISNPTTREYVELPKCDYGSGIMFRRYKIGFNYDVVTDDYKAVAICCVVCSYNVYSTCTYVDVYSLRTNTWKRVTDYPYKHHRWTNKPDGLVNGFLHWVTQGPNDLLVIVAFCLAN
ncbi:F-box/kelch-repeat protein At3g06240-like [Rutidosis leptorrhynchoides]|uniref:F-box/kelch-repeat protein At3g06240-like n=1 Tax=Rutidosis leptorrhynchoides TaxID=125765 RepID=UPI003A9A14D2